MRIHQLFFAGGLLGLMATTGHAQIRPIAPIAPIPVTPVPIAPMPIAPMPLTPRIPVIVSPQPLPLPQPVRLTPAPMPTRPEPPMVRENPPVLPTRHDDANDDPLWMDKALDRMSKERGTLSGIDVTSQVVPPPPPPDLTPVPVVPLRSESSKESEPPRTNWVIAGLLVAAVAFAMGRKSRGR
jgi:hypothetical protein